jgi:hypothetical protein
MSRDKVAFISYARKDGEVFATRLRERLEKEQPEITLWMDRTEMEGGVDFIDQLKRAIDSVQFLILVTTPEAIASKWVQKEWRYAREQGVCVCPVKGAEDAELDEARKSLPRWMSQAHTYDIAKEWERFTNFLKSPCTARRVPFMAPPLPGRFVHRPQEFQAIVTKVLDEKRQNPRGQSVVLVGSGGFGKTTLAASICHDEDVITACDGGILWVTLGEQPSPVRELSKLYAALTGETRTFYDADDAAVQVFAGLQAKRWLLVIDDVWDMEHLKPFLRPPGELSRLITTRLVQIAGEAAEKEYRIDIAELTPEQSVEMLTSRLEMGSVGYEPFRRLARRLGEWPLLLELANSTLREQLQFDETIEGALKWVNQALDEAGITALDRSDAKARHDAIGKTLEISLSGLGDLRERCLELSVFAEDADIPLSVAGALWKQTELQTRRIVQRLGNLSLIKLNLAKSSFRIHDATRAYFASQLGDAVRIHGLVADIWSTPARVTGEYAQRFAVFHIVEAMSDPAQAAARCRQLIELLTDAKFLAHRGQQDLARIYGQLNLAVLRASKVSSVGMPALIAALSVAMRPYEVVHNPERIFELARQGELARAAETVDLFEIDHEWHAAALLLIAWIGVREQPGHAQELVARASALSDMTPLQALHAWIASAPDSIPVGLEDSTGGPDLAYVSGILERAGGTGYQTAIEPLVLEGIYSQGSRVASEARFIAEQDGPPLVDFARQNPAANTQYLRQYIAIHAANRYRYYRNRSLWALMSPILAIPDPPWVRRLVEELIVSALTITTIDFQDSLPLTVKALQAKAGNPEAAGVLDAYKQKLCKKAAQLSPQRGSSDSWAHYQRRAAVLAEIYAVVFGDPEEAARLLSLARGLPKGFAGFRSASSLTLAESFRIVKPDDKEQIDACLVSALAASHRIQDYPFCLQMTTFANAIERRWWPAKPLDIASVVARFLEDSTSGEFSPVFVVGEEYRFRPTDANTLPIPDSVRNARTFAAIVDVCDCSIEKMARVNPPFDPDEVLPAGTEINLNDPEFVPLLAARFAAEALASTSLSPPERTLLIQKLVPMAGSNTTTLDTVLSRLLLAAAAESVALPQVLLDLDFSAWSPAGTASEAMIA